MPSSLGEWSRPEQAAHRSTVGSLVANCRRESDGDSEIEHAVQEYGA